MIQTCELCAALYKYDENLFSNSECWSKGFLERLNSMDVGLAGRGAGKVGFIHGENGTFVEDKREKGVFRNGQLLKNSQVYISI